jgi:hypothetical protein
MSLALVVQERSIRSAVEDNMESKTMKLKYKIVISLSLCTAISLFIVACIKDNGALEAVSVGCLVIPGIYLLTSKDE